MLTLLKHVTALNSNIRAEYNSAYEVAEKNSWASIVANQTEGTGVSEIREFLVEDLKIRMGVGTEYSDLRTHAMTIVHQQASGGFQVLDRDFKSQNALQIKTDAARGLGAKCALLGQDLILKMLNDPNTKAYDGVAFFGSGHFVNYKDSTQGTFTNAETGKALSADNVAAAAAAIESRVMADGTTRNLKAKWLLHPPTLKKAAHEALEAKFISATDNVLTSFGITPVQVPGLKQVGGKDVWIIVAELEGGGTFARPFGVSTLIPMNITNYDGITSRELQRAQMLEYLATGDLAAYVGHPYLVHRCAVA